MRARIDLAYDGTDFAGWAKQPGQRTVQGELESWIPRVMRLAPPIDVIVAGRTDAGVHARGQVAHVDLPDDTDLAELARLLTRVLSRDIVIRSIAPAPDGFDARYSAIWRRYCYRLWDDQSVRDPLLRGHVTLVRSTLDLDAMNSTGTALLGLHEFAPFCRPREGATTIRTLLDLEAQRLADGSVEYWLRADAFCHSMVRSLVGALVAIGQGRRDTAWLAEVMASPKRHNTVLVMPAHGLTLEEVRYPPDADLASRAVESRSVRTLT